MLVEYQDLVALSQYDPTTNRLDFNSWRIMEDATSRDRLVKAKLTTSTGVLTAKGLKSIEIINERLKVLSKGIPVERRTHTDHSAIFNKFPHKQWYVINGKRKLYTNKDLAVFLRKPVPGITFLPFADPESKRGKTLLQDIMREWLSGDFQEASPVVYQLISMIKPGLIWLKNKDGSHTTIQEMYYDFILYVVKEPKFFTQSSGNLIHVREEPYEKKNTKAFVMPFRVPANQEPEAIYEKMF